MSRKIRAILQTGRLGDLWFVVPLADYLAASGEPVEVWYDRDYGDIFEFFPAIIARPTRVLRLIPGNRWLAIIANAAIRQLVLYVAMRRAGRRVIWNEIYPWRLGAYIANRPYPDYWYRSYPRAHTRRARTTLPVENEKTILFFAASLSLRIGVDSSYTAWLEDNLEILREHTGYKIIFVPPPGAPDHPRYETWRGDLRAYQQLIARCGIIYGVNTSAHVLGQLLGKAVVACYPRVGRTIDTIGKETAKLFPGERLTTDQLRAVSATI